MASSVTLHHPRRHEDGAVAILVALLMLVMVGLLGTVIDLGHLYVRKTELQNAADAAALAGARLMDRTAAGLDEAVHGTDGAIALAAANASDFAQTPVTLPESAVSFGPTPDGPWSALAAAKADALRMGFIRVDTTGLAQGQRPTWFMSIVDPLLASTQAAGIAVAGAAVCDGMPLFICPPASGTFVPGQSYFFGESPGYPIGPGNIGYFDPVPPGSRGMISGNDDMRNAICAGRTYCLQAPMSFTSLTQNAFGTMARAINTRFDDFASLPTKLTPEICRPDTNVREYRYTDLSPAGRPMAWMTPVPDRQSEQDSGATLGVHWSAVRPAGSALAGVPASANATYPASGTPYGQTAGSVFHAAPSPASRSAALDGRRIITMAIASNCGAINGAGKPVQVTGFGRFFLPVRAVGTGGRKGIYVEYIETVSALRASVPDIKLFR